MGKIIQKIGPPVRTCSRCHKRQPANWFPRKDCYKCRDCFRLYESKWHLKKMAKEVEREKHSRSVRKVSLRIKYGLTLEAYDAMLAGQNGVCAICHRPETQISPDGMPKNLAVDHDADTKLVRGLLCMACNTCIGKMDHKPELLIRAAEYLKSRGY